MDANARVGRNLDRGNYVDEVIIILPDRRVLSLLARSLFLAAALLILPWLQGVQELFDSGVTSGAGLEPPSEDLIQTAFRDLLKEHLLTVGEYAVFIGESPEVAEIRALIDDGILPPVDIVDEKNDNGRSITNGTVDFAFAANGFYSLALIDRILRVGGVAALRFGTAADTHRIQPNYKIVYLRRFELPDLHTVVAIRKMSAGSREDAEATEKKPSFCAASDAKRKAVRDLEDVLLEPPDDTFLESGEYLKRIKYLPKLTGDSLESQSGHVYVDVGRSYRFSGIGEWFRRSYPTSGRDFDVYALDADVAGTYSPVAWTRKAGFDAGPVGLSDWLKRHVAEDEFVVMKMDVGGSAELLKVLREMVRSKAVCLVDELFLVCDHADQEGKDRNRAERKAYWECLALYGMLRKGSVAVHQWWG